MRLLSALPALLCAALAHTASLAAEAIDTGAAEATGLSGAPSFRPQLKPMAPAAYVFESGSLRLEGPR